MNFSNMKKELSSIGFVLNENGSMTKSTDEYELTLENLSHERLSCFQFRVERLEVFARKCFKTLSHRTRGETMQAVLQAIDCINNAESPDDIKKWRPMFTAGRNHF